MADLDTLVNQVWSPETRRLAGEALRCYNTGAFRASIAATWTAVTADIITKLIGLADDGDSTAIPFRTAVTNAQAHGLNREGVKAMQAIEADLLTDAEKFELIDAIDAHELSRIQEDRNLCVHPSLRLHGGTYEPHAEVARGHLVVALTALLTHPPMQGSRALDEFKSYICDSSFSPTPAHLQAAFFDRVRSAAQRRIIQLAAKSALLELDPGGLLPAIEHADRMAVALEAFAARNRALVREAVTGQRDKFRTIDGPAQTRALIRFADEDYFWDLVDEGLANRLQDLVVQVPVSTPGQLTAVQAITTLALVRSPLVRERLPKLEAHFLAHSWWDQMTVAGAHPDRYFAELIPGYLTQAGAWRVGEQVGQLLVKHARFLTLDILSAALTAWVENYQCRTANLMETIAVDLWNQTAHLGPARTEAFQNFLTRAREHEGDTAAPGYYTYRALELALTATP
ncbi:hypothetical protein AB0B94_20835 [Micromonospora sp. NPDC048986]|uniref:hypothetical protein n=1 Tax=Micromonospora sp. NPDC048986 TaxID=3155644 RepID=UPI00340BCA64